MTGFSKVSKRLYSNNPSQTKCSVGTEMSNICVLERRYF